MALVALSHSPLPSRSSKLHPLACSPAPSRGCSSPYVNGAPGQGLAATRLLVARWSREHAQATRERAQASLQGLLLEHQRLSEAEADAAAAEKLLRAAADLREHAERFQSSEAVASAAQDQRVSEAQAVREEMRRAREEVEETLRRERQQEEQRAFTDRVERQEPLKMLLETYQTRLGLAIERVGPGTTRWTFEGLLDDGKSASFVLAAREGADDLFELTEVEPELADSSDLLRSLNSDSSPTSLPKFVCGMRRAFRQAHQAQQ